MTAAASLAAQPRTFTDAKGRTWDLSLTMGICKRVDRVDFSALTTLKFSLLRPTEALFTELAMNGALLYGVCWYIVQPQAKAFPADPDEAELEFCDAADARTIEDARAALWGALADFFPQHRTGLLRIQAGCARALEVLEEKELTTRPEALANLEKTIEEGLRKLPQTPAEPLGEPSTP